MLKRVMKLMPAAAATALVLGGCVLQGSKGGGMMPGAQRQEQRVERVEAARPAPRVSGACDTVFYPTGHEVGAAVRLDRYGPTEVTQGANFDYELRVTNVSPRNLSNVMVSEATASAFTFGSAVPNPTSNTPGSGAGAGSLLVFNLGDMATGETKTIKITGKAGTAAQIASCAAVSFTIPSCCVVNVTAPALKITKAAPAEVGLCDMIPIRLVVTNSGTGMARNVTVRDALPSGLMTADGKNVFEANIGSLGAGESRNVDFNAKTDKVGTYNNSATAAAEGGLNASSNTTTTVVKNCALAITKTVNAAQQFSGRNATWTITVTNNGDGVARNVSVSDSLNNSTFVSATEGGRANGGGAMWSIGDLAPRQSKTLQLVTNSGGFMGTVTNTATASSSDRCCAAATATATIEYRSLPAIVIELVDDPDPVAVGEETTFTIKVRNQGFKADSNLKAVFTLANGMQFVSGGGASAVTASGQTITLGTIPSIGPKQEVAWTVRVRCTAANGDVRSKLSVTTDFFKNPIDEEESTNLYQ